MDYGRFKSRTRKRCMKKILAVSMAVITAFSCLPVSRPVTAKAAKPYVSLRTAFKTLQTGGTNRMTLKNNTLGWKIKKVSTKDRTIAMVYGKTASSFMIKGKSEGRTTVRAKLKTTARKKHNTKTVRCRVKVVAADAQNPSEATVSTQAELDRALQSKNLKKLEIRTNDPVRLVIPKGTYADAELTVQAPAADIENNGVFKSITIQAIKPDTWFENAVGNVMKVVAAAARIVVNPGARLEKVNFARADAKVSLEVNGAIGEVSISAKMEISISGKPEAPINTVIEETAEGTVLVTSAPLNVTVHASADITFNEGAENSTVEIKSEKAKVNVVNNTNATITVKKADGTIERKTARLRAPSSSGSSSSSGSYRPPSVPVTGPAVDVPTGPAITPDDNPGSLPGGGGDDPYLPGGVYDNYSIDLEDFVAVMNPHITIIITRSAIEVTDEATPVSVSAILSMQITPEAASADEGETVRIRWGLDERNFAEGTDESLYEMKEVNDTETVTFEVPDPYDANLFNESGSYNILVNLEYISSAHELPADLQVAVMVYNEVILNEWIQDMEKRKLTSMQWDITGVPTTDGGSIIGWGERIPSNEQ